MNIYKNKTIRDKTVAIQLLATVSHQIVHYTSPEEQFSSFSSIGNKELYKLVKHLTMLDPVPSKLLKEVLPEVIDPLLNINNSSLLSDMSPKPSNCLLLSLSLKKHNLTPNNSLISDQSRISLYCQRYYKR